MQMRLNSLVLGISLAACFLQPAPGRAAPLLKVDFGVSGAASPVQPGFSGLAGEISETTHSASIGPYTVDLDGQGFYSTGGNANNIAAGVRSLYRDYYYNNSTLNGEGIVLTLGGFDPNTQYNVTLWSYDADGIFTPTPTTWDPFGNTAGTSGSITNFATPYPTTLSDRSATVQVSSTSGTLELFGTTTGGNSGTRLNAFKVNDGATDLLAVDFGRTGQPSSPIQSTYTGLLGEIAQPAFSQTVGAFNVSLEGQGFYNTTTSNADLVDAGVRDFYRDYYYNNSITNGEGVTLTIDGVTPNTDYELKIWSYDADNFSPTPTTWTPTGVTSGAIGNITNVQDPYPTSLTDNSATIRVRSTSTSLKLFGTTTEGTGGTRINGFELSVAPPGITGDYNNDGFVDAADYVLWRNGGPLQNDPSAGVQPSDFDQWRANFGMSGPGSGAGNVGAVPEPSTLIVLATGLVFALFPVRRNMAR